MILSKKKNAQAYNTPTNKSKSLKNVFDYISPVSFQNTHIFVDDKSCSNLFNFKAIISKKLEYLKIFWKLLESQFTQ